MPSYLLPYATLAIAMLTAWMLAIVLYDAFRHDRGPVRTFVDGLIVLGIAAIVTGVLIASAR